MKMNKPLTIFFISMSLLGCKSSNIVKIDLLTDFNNVFMNDLITLYAKSYNVETGNITISKDNLVSLEQQLKACIEVGLFNINNYLECKEKNIDYLYSFFEIEQGNIMYKQKESYKLIYDPQNERAIKTGRETGYVKIPDLNVKNELLLLINYYSFYKELGMTLMKVNKNFFIDLDKYNFEINSYFQNYGGNISLNK
jgi:lipoprotein